MAVLPLLLPLFCAGLLLGFVVVIFSSRPGSIVLQPPSCDSTESREVNAAVQRIKGKSLRKGWTNQSSAGIRISENGHIFRIAGGSTGYRIRDDGRIVTVGVSEVATDFQIRGDGRILKGFGILQHETGYFISEDLRIMYEWTLGSGDTGLSFMS